MGGGDFGVVGGKWREDLRARVDIWIAAGIAKAQSKLLRVPGWKAIRGPEGPRKLSKTKGKSREEGGFYSFSVFLGFDEFSVGWFVDFPSYFLGFLPWEDAGSDPLIQNLAQPEDNKWGSQRDGKRHRKKYQNVEKHRETWGNNKVLGVLLVVFIGFVYAKQTKPLFHRGFSFQIWPKPVWNKCLVFWLELLYQILPVAQITPWSNLKHKKKVNNQLFQILVGTKPRVGEPRVGSASGFGGPGGGSGGSGGGFFLVVSNAFGITCATITKPPPGPPEPRPGPPNPLPEPTRGLPSLGLVPTNIWFSYFLTPGCPGIDFWDQIRIPCKKSAREPHSKVWTRKTRPENEESHTTLFCEPETHTKQKQKNKWETRKIWSMPGFSYFFPGEPRRKSWQTSDKNNESIRKN